MIYPWVWSIHLLVTFYSYGVTCASIALEIWLQGLFLILISTLPFEVVRSTSTVGFPLLSKISRAWILESPDIVGCFWLDLILNNGWEYNIQIKGELYYKPNLSMFCVLSQTLFFFFFNNMIIEQINQETQKLH